MGKKGFGEAETKATESTKSGARYAYFKTEVDKVKTVRFVTVDGGTNSISTYAEHFTKFKNGWSRSTSCPDYNNEPGDRKTCLLCTTPNKGPGEDIVRDDYGTKMIMQVIERGCGEQGEDVLKVFKFSPFFFTTIVAFHKEYGDLGDRDYSLQMFKDPGDRPGRDKTRYEMIPLSKKPTPTSDGDDVIIALRASLDDIEPKYDESEIRKIMAMPDKPASNAVKAKANDAIAGFMSTIAPVKKDSAPVAVSDETDETPAPRTKTAPVAVADDDDDDTTDFFAALRARNGK